MAHAESWNLQPPPGFQGLREDLPLQMYVRHMPHWRQAGATYFVTFRLADSIPDVRLQELARIKSDWEARQPQDKGSFEKLARMIFEKVETWLDQGMGSCVLREKKLSSCVNESLQKFCGQRYQLGASVVMPNHVHCIVKPTEPESNDLEDIIGSWKSYTARKINAQLQQSGALWQEESYDRIIRDENHLWRCLQYIGRNPLKSHLSPDACCLWMNPDWQSLGWRFVT